MTPVTRLTFYAAVSASLGLLCSCGGSGSNPVTGGGGGAVKYSSVKFSEPGVFNEPAVSPYYQTYGVTTNGRFYGGAPTTAVAAIWMGVSDPDGGAMNQGPNLIGHVFGAIINQAISAANNNGNAAVQVVSTGGQGAYTSLYTSAVTTDPTSYTQISFLMASGTIALQSPVSLNNKKEVLLKQNNGDGTFDLEYQASPGAATQTLFSPSHDFTASIDENSGIAISADHAYFAATPTTTPVLLKDGSGASITSPILHSPSGEIVVQSTPPAYFAAGDQTHIHLVNQGAATATTVNFINSTGSASGTLTTSTGETHAAVWSSLSATPDDISDAVTGVTLVNAKYVFNDGTLIAVDGTGQEYKLTPL